jgi:endonuclease/exonuclease/phosphatase (EEP) superfamily protein YafD
VLANAVHTASALYVSATQILTLSRLATRAPSVFGWVMILGLLVAVLFRLVAWDQLQIFVMADALGGLFYLPAWPIGLTAAVTRRWLLLAASLLVVLAQVAFSLPEFTAASPVPAAARHAFTFRLYDANVYASNKSMKGYSAELRQFRPDLVAMEEASPTDRRQLQGSGVLDSLTHVIEVNRFDPRAFLIASRYRLGRASVSSIDGLPFLVQTTLRLPGGLVQLWVVHTTAPVNPGWHLWYDELQRIEHLLEARDPRPLLLVGDFNATWGNSGFRSILGTGLSDAAAARGEALDMTWSQMFFVLPPLMRIDHVVTSASLVATTIHTEPGPGSDHRALEASVAVLRSPSDAPIRRSARGTASRKVGTPRTRVLADDRSR